MTLLGLTGASVLFFLWRDRGGGLLLFGSAFLLGLGVNSRLTLGPFDILLLNNEEKCPKLYPGSLKVRLGIAKKINVKFN